MLSLKKYTFFKLVYYQTDTRDTYSFSRLVQNDILHPNGVYSATSRYRYALDNDVLEEHEERRSV
ncbi:hypothetical protein OK016_26660 [Vibrio chagasii]|nr:hypothetical protein [Vibrio chagasii]